MSDSRSFPYPLQDVVLDHFVHPAARLISRPVSHEGDVLTLSGYIACRFTRGLWFATDFDPAPAEFLERFEKLPWARFEKLSDNWGRFDDVRGNLYRYSTIRPWTAQGKCPAGPVWRVNGCFLARLCHLQLIARLPRCEVHLGELDSWQPLMFRFTGGMGMLAHDTKLTTASYSIFEPGRHEDGTRKDRRKTPPPNLGLKDWPPPEPADP